MAIVRLALSVPLIVGALPACAIARPAPPPQAVAMAATASPARAPRAEPALLSRSVLFAPPDHADVKISPDGQRIGWLGPLPGGLNLWVGPADDVGKAQPVTQETTGSVRSWWWTFGSDRIVFARERADDESGHLYVVDVAKKETRDLTPIDGVRAELLGLSPKRPKEALVGVNDRDKKFQDVYLVDIATGARKLVQQNDGGYDGWLADDDLRVRYGERQNSDASTDILRPARGKEPSSPLLHVPVEDSLSVEAVAFDKSGDALYLRDSRGRDTSALVALDTKSGKTTVVVQDPRADAGQVLLHPGAKTVEAVSFDYDKRIWNVVDSSVEGDLYYLQTFGDGTPLVTSRSLDEQRWIVGYAYPDGPTAYYRYDRDPDIPGNPGKATFLFRSQDALEHAKLSAMKPVVVKARDGLDLVSYLTLPYAEDPRDEGRPKAPLPLVILVHDGPWSRVTGEYSPEHQWLASRGYAVLSVNYRGSTGFGKKFVEAANLQWGTRMQEDLIDVAKWAIDEKIANPAKVAIVGVGYGGYATLVGMTAGAQLFACGVDVGGPSNLLAFMQNIPPSGQSHVEGLARRVGDWRTDEGKRLLADRSPMTHVGAIKNPLLIEQGKTDPRVTETDTAQFVEALRAARVPVTYALYPDEGHTLKRTPNRMSFGVLTEIFLAQCLGGPYEPIGGDLAGSTLTVPVGAQYIHGLREAMGIP
ncbi:MAG: prolyl oligopeptidase family serine peptidase [Polyangiaceae bacterium]|jgi:dipeptidyl aminopeptidase/acylaminoacyl peptidase